MERLCPECLGTLEARDGGVARCTVHGGDYKILFWRALPPLLPPLPPTGPAPAASVVCANHPNLPAIFVCGRCNAAICDLCSFPQDDGSRLCPACSSIHATEPARRGGVSANTLAVQDRKCAQHPNVAAVQICQTCGAAMCATCDFLLPGNYHVCPACATAPRTGMSLKRKKLLMGSFALAVWCTLVMVALMAGVFHNMAQDKAAETALDMLLTFFLLIPSIIGMALGFSSMDRRLPNTIAMWVATAWNGLILAGYILLLIVGLLAKG